MKNKFIYITGGARSGKSTLAVEIAGKLRGRTIFLATAEPLDGEMEERIRIHRKNRPAGWITMELSAYKNMNAVLEAMKNSGCRVAVIDCLTLWIANLLGRRANNSGKLTGSEYARVVNDVTNEMNTCLNALRKFSGTVIAVSNEVGMGIVPDNQISRVFRDICGRVNQHAAEISDKSYFMVSGMSVILKK